MILTLLAMIVGCGPVPSEERLPSVPSVGASDTAVAQRRDGTRQGAMETGAEPILSISDRSSIFSETLVVPTWMANDLASSDVQVKLQALDHWAHSAPVGSVDPLVRALEDADETVQAKALSLIEQDWIQSHGDEK